MEIDHLEKLIPELQPSHVKDTLQTIHKNRLARQIADSQMELALKQAELAAKAQSMSLSKEAHISLKHKPVTSVELHYEGTKTTQHLGTQKVVFHKKTASDFLFGWIHQNPSGRLSYSF